MISKAKEPMSHQKSKHILIRKIVARRDIVVERVPSTKNIINLLTKPLAQKVFECNKKTMKLIHKGD